MLQLAVHYLNHDIVGDATERNDIDLESIVIFLNLHVPEHSSTPKQPHGSTFDSVWPLNADGEMYPSSPVSSPSSPVRDAQRGHRVLSPMGSPRSPRNVSPQGLQSPKRASPSSPRTPRISTQHLHSVRQKLSVILRMLCWCSRSDSKEDIAQFMTEDHKDNSEGSFPVARRVADFLGMIICGGYSRDQFVRGPLCFLFHIR